MALTMEKFNFDKLDNILAKPVTDKKKPMSRGDNSRRQKGDEFQEGQLVVEAESFQDSDEDNSKSVGFDGSSVMDQTK